MTKIKLCGLTKAWDIEAANRLKPDYIGFVFAPKSRRYLPYEQAALLKAMLHPDITAVGVFVNEPVSAVAGLLKRGIIDMVQLHGNEDEAYIAELRGLSDKPVIQAFVIHTKQDIALAQNSSADYILLDSGSGTGNPFDWQLIQRINRPYFLAGGLDPDNVVAAIEALHPYAVDVSSGIETAGLKSAAKMEAFVHAVRGNHRKEETNE